MSKGRLLHAFGLMVWIIGVLLIIGNVTRFFPTFPFAGYLVTVVGFSIQKMGNTSIANAAARRATNPDPFAPDADAFTAEPRDYQREFKPQVRDQADLDDRGWPGESARFGPEIDSGGGRGPATRIPQILLSGVIIAAIAVGGVWLARRQMKASAAKSDTIKAYNEYANRHNLFANEWQKILKAVPPDLAKTRLDALTRARRGMGESISAESSLASGDLVAAINTHRDSTIACIDAAEKSIRDEKGRLVPTKLDPLFVAIVQAKDEVERLANRDSKAIGGIEIKKPPEDFAAKRKALDEDKVREATIAAYNSFADGYRQFAEALTAYDEAKDKAGQVASMAKARAAIDAIDPKMGRDQAKALDARREIPRVGFAPPAPSVDSGVVLAVHDFKDGALAFLDYHTKVDRGELVADEAVSERLGMAWDAAALKVRTEVERVNKAIGGLEILDE